MILALNATAISIVVGFFLSVCYRMAFPLGRHDWQISIAELCLMLPMAIGAFWLLARALRKDRSGTRFYKFICWIADGGPTRRLTASAIGAILLVQCLKLAASIMRSVF
jgi:hypothetical protein